MICKRLKKVQKGVSALSRFNWRGKVFLQSFWNVDITFISSLQTQGVHEESPSTSRRLSKNPTVLYPLTVFPDSPSSLPVFLLYRSDCFFSAYLSLTLPPFSPVVRHKFFSPLDFAPVLTDVRLLCFLFISEAFFRLQTSKPFSAKKY
eukprot:g6176.t1